MFFENATDVVEPFAQASSASVSLFRYRILAMGEFESTAPDTTTSPIFLFMRPLLVTSVCIQETTPDTSGTSGILARTSLRLGCSPSAILELWIQQFLEMFESDLVFGIWIANLYLFPAFGNFVLFSGQEAGLGMSLARRRLCIYGRCSVFFGFLLGDIDMSRSNQTHYTIGIRI
jgi:hypothetical protein